MQDAEVDILEPGLWGAHVTESNPVPLESGERRLTVSRATLEKGDRAQLFLGIKGTNYALGTLIKDKKEYTKIGIDIFEGTDEKYTFSVVGNGTVALIGSYSPPLFDDGDDEFGSLSDLEESDENDDEDDEAVAAALKAAVKPKPVGKPQQGAKPAATQPAQKGQTNPPKGQPNQPKAQTQQKGQPGQKGQGQQKGQPQQKSPPNKGQPKGKAATQPTEVPNPVSEPTTQTTSAPESPGTPTKPEVMEEDKSDSTPTATTPPKKGGKPVQKKGGQNPNPNPNPNQKKSPPAKTGASPKAGNPPKSPAAVGNQAKRPNTPTQGNSQKKQKK